MGKGFNAKARRCKGAKAFTEANEVLTTYSLPEVIHGLCPGLVVSPDKEPVNNFGARLGFATLSPVAVRMFNHVLTMNEIRPFDDDRIQSRSHAHSDAGTGCLALYELQPAVSITNNDITNNDYEQSSCR